MTGSTTPQFQELEIPVAMIKRQVERILASDVFIRSERMSRFLRFTVDQVINGSGESLKEYLIGLAVYDKPETLDPRFNPIVRVEAGRLRSKLREYYEHEGRHDPVLINYPKRSYAPHFNFRTVPGVLPIRDSYREAQALRSLEGKLQRPVASIAVLPLIDLSPGRDQSELCEGLCRRIIDCIAQSGGIRVVRTSNEAGDVRMIGRRLGVEAVLEGSIRSFHAQLRVCLQLNSTRDGFHLWSETHDGDKRRRRALERQVSAAVLARIKPEHAGMRPLSRAS
ncbi:MAG: hypothetical protein KJZ78_11050 [Bryobacteraceae bacterium]|nr:hypothetical protein [Bryobacteraceae bacterium]